MALLITWTSLIGLHIWAWFHPKPKGRSLLYDNFYVTGAGDIDWYEPTISIKLVK